METVQTFQSWVKTIVTSSIGVVSGFLINEMTQSQEITWLIVISGIVFVVIMEKSLGWILEELIEQSLLLRKLILGKHFIEGYWVERVIHSSDPSLNYGYSLINIAYSKSGYLVEGEILDSQCSDSIGNFQSKHAKYTNGSLEYFFSGINVTDVNDKTIVGTTEFLFSYGLKYPTRLKGKIIDTKNKSVLKLEAEKLGKSWLDKYSIEKEADVINLVREYTEGWNK